MGKDSRKACYTAFKKDVLFIEAGRAEAGFEVSKTSAVVKLKSHYPVKWIGSNTPNIPATRTAYSRQSAHMHPSRAPVFAHSMDQERKRNAKLQANWLKTREPVMNT